ncbi:MAG TPA: sensor domain-containing diguanylate cyclase [Candidatus Dormibacteraeota bacterium]|nr:sensor domain-containing diguanylate cyclase [Candidatus Dormibacteraeota bacterium]
MALSAVLLVATVLLVVALGLLTLAMIRLRGTTRELEQALAEQSGSRHQADLLLKVAEAVNSSLALSDVLNVALTQAGRLLGAVAGAMYLVTPGKAEMRRQADYNLTHNAKGAGRKLDEEPLRSVIAEARPLVVPLDAQHAPGLEGGGHPSHVLVVPVQRSGQLMGAFELYLNGSREIREDQVELLLGVAAQAAMAISHAQLFQAQEENALTDELTKLPNRRYMAQRFLQEMQRARRHHKGLAFLMIDIDHFKLVNDTYGHLQGDTVLAELGKILVSCKRESDVAARYGGEEFGLILHETNEAGAMTLAERIRAQVEAAKFPGDLRLTISIGVAASEDESQFSFLLEKADQALYAAKQAGRNTVRAADMKAVAAGQRE